MQGNFAMLENQAFPTYKKNTNPHHILHWWRLPYFSITASLLFLWATKWEAQQVAQRIQLDRIFTFMLKSICSWAKCEEKESVYEYVEPE